MMWNLLTVMNYQTGLILLAGLLALAGCSTTGTDDNGFATTEFRDGATFRLKSPDALKGYESIYLKSVVATPMHGSKKHDPSELAALEYSFENAFKSAVSSVMPIVDAPGPKTLSVEATVGEVMHVNHNYNVTANNPADGANTYGPGATDPAGRPLAAPVSGSTICMCSVHLKVKFLDSQSGELLANFSDGDFGADVEVDQSGKTNWARVSEAMNGWCQDIKQELLAVTK